MLRLITGGTGDGKSLLAITRLKKARADWDAQVKAGTCPNPKAEFRTNIKGCVVPGVIPDLDADWRQYPDGSVLVYDEAHQEGLFRTTGQSGLSNIPYITQLDEHRHRGFDITFLTQFPNKIHHEVRKLVKHQIHLVRSMGMERAAMREWFSLPSGAHSDPDSQEAKDKMTSESIWEFPTENYALYKSAEVHTHKFEMPKGLKNGAISVGFIVLVLAGIWFLYLGPKVSGAAAPKGKDAVASSQALPVSPSPPEQPGSISPPNPLAGAEVLPAMKGCAITSKACRCWNGQGQQLSLSQALCLETANAPATIDFSTSSASSSSSPWGNQVAAVAAPAASQFIPEIPAVLQPGGGSGKPRIGDNKLPIHPAP